GHEVPSRHRQVPDRLPLQRLGLVVDAYLAARRRLLRTRWTAHVQLAQRAQDTRLYAERHQGSLGDAARAWTNVVQRGPLVRHGLVHAWAGMGFQRLRAAEPGPDQGSVAPAALPCLDQ